MTPELIEQLLVHKSFIRFRPRLDVIIPKKDPQAFYAICVVAGRESLWCIMKDNGKFHCYAGSFKQVREIVPDGFTFERVKASWGFYKAGAMDYRNHIEQVRK